MIVMKRRLVPVRLPDSIYHLHNLLCQRSVIETLKSLSSLLNGF